MAETDAFNFDPELLKGFDAVPEKHDSNRYENDDDRLNKWDRRYIELAAHVASWSKDKAKVGCVIVNPVYGRAITFSFNGFPANVADDEARRATKDQKLPRTLHAEQNAVLYAGREARGCHAYVVGKPVCNICAILLIQAGVRRVVAAAPKAAGTYTPPQEAGAIDWEEMGRLALTMFHEAGVGFKTIDTEFNAELVRKYGLNEVQAGFLTGSCECKHD